MRYVIYPYKMGSQGAKALAEGLGCKRVYPDRRYRYKRGDVILNWGNSYHPDWMDRTPTYNLLNSPHAVELASNKLEAFKLLQGEVSVPAFTEDIDEAEDWVQGGDRIYCRTKLTGHSGDGIVVAKKPTELVEAPLYTRGITGYRDEYRVHVVNGKVIDVQMKRKKRDADPNTLVRNHHNGYVYCREDVEISDAMECVALDAVDALYLDFGAVDIVKSRDGDDMWVLEVNTAPGLTGTTLTKYVEAFEELKGEY